MAKAASCTVELDLSALQQLAGNDSLVRGALDARTAQIMARANALGSGFRTGHYHPNHQSPGVGGTQPAYVGDVRMGRRGYVGIVHPGNYAAMKDNYENNTLLKSKG